MNSIKILIITGLFFLAGNSFAQPVGYYNGTEGLSGEELKTALHNIINEHVYFSYSYARDIIAYSDADTANADNVILFYTQESRYEDNYGSGGDYINREHVWAKSHGGFDDELPMNSDAHNLRPADASVNEDRSAKDFDNVQPNGTQHSEAMNCWYSDSAWEPGPKVKGQVARILFYMATRYEGDNDELDLELIDKLNNYPNPLFGKLSTLLEWNNTYPPSDFERRRNERIYEIQQNRNPFIDNPEFANLIWNNATVEDLQFSDLNMEPEIPAVGDDANISLKISATTAPDSVLLFWGSTYDSKENKTELSQNADSYTTPITFDNVEAGETTYFLVQAFANADTFSIRASYTFPETIAEDDLTAITEVQGTSSESPLLGEQVTIAGRVTANFDNTVYIQQKNESSRAGICVYDALKTGNIGDSIVVTGTVAEYATLTELSDIEYLYNFKQTDSIAPMVVTTTELSEDLEGMLVTIENVTFNDGGSTVKEQNTSFTFYDDYGEGTLYSAWNSKIVGETLPSGKVNLTGVVSAYNGSYQILARGISDLSSIITSSPIIKAAESDISIYPNPASDRVYFSTSDEISSAAIFSISGQLLEKISRPGTSISTSELTNGVYILQLTTDSNESVHKKFAVSH